MGWNDNRPFLEEGPALNDPSDADLLGWTLVGQGSGKAGLVDLTCQHKNPTLLVEGPEITIRPVGTRRVTGGSR